MTETTYNMNGEVISINIITDIFEIPAVDQSIIDAMNERLSEKKGN